MFQSFFFPKQSDYPGRYRLGGSAFGLGLVLLLMGLSVENGILQTLSVSAGVALVIGGAFVCISAYRSQKRAEETSKG
jgi:hypothetical protein